MAWRDLVRDWLPPAILGAVRRLRSGKEPAAWEYRPGGWSESDVRGWDAESVVEAQLRTWEEFRRLVSGAGPLGINPTDRPLHAFNYPAHNTIVSFGYVLAVAAQGRSRLTLLDWGGGLGHYALLSQALLPSTPLDYYCKELPLLCAAGRRLLPDVTFLEAEEECRARRYDLVLSSSSLHYSQDWRGTLQMLAELTDSYLYVTRLPVVRSAASFVVLQRPYGCYQTEYLGWFLNRQELLTCAAQSGLELVREFLIDERPEVPGAPEQCEYRGYLFRRPGPTTEPSS
ncbi:MAG TPA: methyltransferase domain-containing protein [Armatimonadota bacterium]|nr:methyltransferase domain-containing protein [Armatimonadota bacterium]